MDFKTFSVARRQFPRFDNACAKSAELQTRYDNLYGEGNSLTEIKNVMIVLCKRKGNKHFPVDINTLISDISDTSNVEIGNLFDSCNIKTLSRSLEQNDESVCVFVVDGKEKTETDHLLKNNIMAITDDANIEIESRYHGKFNVTIAKRENLKIEIDNLLERISLAPLKEICEHCFTLFKENTLANTDTKTIRNAIKIDKLTNEVEQGHHSGNHYTDESSEFPVKSHLNKRRKVKASNTTTQQTIGSDVVAEKLEQPKSYRNKCKTGLEVINTSIYQRTRSHSKGEEKVNGHLESELNGYQSSKKNEPHNLRKLIPEHTSKRPTEDDQLKIGKKRKEDVLERTSSKDPSNGEDIERLLEAILAVYGMSNVPESERPSVPNQSKKIKEQLREELFKICPTIKRIGYRYRTFYIYAVQPVRHREREIRNKKIRSLMEKYRIFPYKIAQYDEEIQELRVTGAKIEARSDILYSLRSREVCRPEVSKGGTLGCFVKTKTGNQQFCLLSKHVTEKCSDIFYVENGNSELLGHIIPETNSHVDRGLDISAARMHGPVREDSAKFKDTRGKPLKGRLHEYDEEDEDYICRSGQSVHIHGAMTRPGKGEITMPIVDMGLTSPLIQVEDISENVSVHFADNGDSGAVICVEDPGNKHVHALGMVIGDVSKNSPRRKYLALPLSKGIQQIEEQTNTRLELI